MKINTMALASSALVAALLVGCGNGNTSSSVASVESSSSSSEAVVFYSSSSSSSVAPVVSSSSSVAPVSSSSSSEAPVVVAFEVTSTEIDNGAGFPDRHTCEGGQLRDGTSPKLDWTEGPKGTQSYAIVFRDKTLVDDGQPQFGFHWMIWNIPTSINTLPEALEGGTNPSAMGGATQSGPYFGPCPNYGGGSETHEYVFSVYAMDTETTSFGSGMEQAFKSFEANALEIATFTVTSNAKTK